MADRDLALAILLSKYSDLSFDQVGRVLDSAKGNQSIADRVLARLSKKGKSGSSSRGRGRGGGGSRGAQASPAQQLGRHVIISKGGHLGSPYTMGATSMGKSSEVQDSGSRPTLQSRVAQQVASTAAQVISPSAAERKEPIVLFDNEYFQTVNNHTGEVELIVGPQRLFLPSNRNIFRTKRTKIVLHEDEYMYMCNPYDGKLKKSILGSKAVVQGPLVRALWPDEYVEGNRVYKATILSENQAAVVMASNDTEDHKAGEMWLRRGPDQWIPKRHEELVRIVNAVHVSQFDAVYVRDRLTCKIRLVKGPLAFIPGVHEELYQKTLAPHEYEALSRPPEPSSRAVEIQVQKGQCVCVVDHVACTERYVVGPEGLILGPYEGVKVLTVADGLPKIEHRKRVAVLGLGPDFMQDSFDVRTSDNAILRLTVAYKWKFVVDEANMDNLFRGDYIGYSCQSLRSRIRETVSAHEFKTFNVSSSEILRTNIFKDVEIPVVSGGKPRTERVNGRYFGAYNFLVFGLDVKNITATDAEIARLLNESLKSNMSVLVRKKQSAARHQSNKSEVVNKIEIEKMKSALIEQKNSNFKLERIERCRIGGLAKVEGAKASAEAEVMIAGSRVELELANLSSKLDLLKSEGGDEYIQFRKAKLLGKKLECVTVLPSSVTTVIIEEDE